MPNILRRAGLLQEAAKRLVAELPRDVFQSPQMIARPIGRRDKQEKEMNFVAVEAVEIDTGDADAHGANEPLDAGMLGMRHGNAAADAGAPQVFALHDRADDALHL